jgi:tRNA-specific 2-thiouridylase
LFNIDKYLIPHLIFPLGDYLKSEVVQEIAKIPELKDIASNRESLEICFVENSYVDVIRDYKNVDEVGDVIDENGNLIGKHKGYIHYTIGKRKGFTLKVAHEPHYVTKIIPEKNQIVVGTRDKLKKYEATLGNLNMFIDETEFQAGVKLRYRSKLLKANIKIENEIAEVKLHKPIFGLAKGQAGVFYRDGKVIGGGWIL